MSIQTSQDNIPADQSNLVMNAAAFVSKCFLGSVGAAGMAVAVFLALGGLKYVADSITKPKSVMTTPAPLKPAGTNAVKPIAALRS
jgi:hypothetical protein